MPPRACPIVQSSPSADFGPLLVRALFFYPDRMITGLDFMVPARKPTTRHTYTSQRRVASRPLKPWFTKSQYAGWFLGWTSDSIGTTRKQALIPEV